jgi:hypothetical protein
MDDDVVRQVVGAVPGQIDALAADLWKVSSFGRLARSSSRSSTRCVSSCRMRVTFLSNSEDAPTWSAWWCE